jgi:hypothetical protein
MFGPPEGVVDQRSNNRHRWPYAPLADFASSKNYRFSANMQVVLDVNTRLTVAVGPPHTGQPQRLPGLSRFQGVQHHFLGSC